jgi:serine/threonine protein kinase
MTPDTTTSSIKTALPSSYTAGHVIGRKYVLEQRLGEGRAGGVWRAQNLALGSEVALKLLAAGALRTADAVERLLREARTEASCQEPGVVRVFDVEQSELGDAFIAMELLEGQTLAALLEQRGRIDAVEAARLLLPVVAVLVAVHARGSAHGNLEPANIVLVPTPEGLRPTLIDFGSLDAQVLGCADDISAVCRILHEAVAGGAPLQAGDSYASMHELGMALAQFLLARGVSTDVSGVGVAEAWLRKKPIRARMLVAFQLGASATA